MVWVVGDAVGVEGEDLEETEREEEVEERSDETTTRRRGGDETKESEEANARWRCCFRR